MVDVELNQLVLALAISPMNMMWISFYSIGFMMVAMLLISLSRHKIANVFLRTIVSLLAYLFLIVGALTMVFVIFYW